MKPLFMSAVMGLMLAMFGPAAAHHAFSSEFDINKPFKWSGTVTNMEWTNPHAWLYVDVEDASGRVQNWRIELVGINSLMRLGWGRDKVKPGDIVEVEGYGARDGTTTGNAASVTVANTGELLWQSVRLGAED